MPVLSDETLNAAAEYGYAVLRRDKAFTALQKASAPTEHNRLLAALGSGYVAALTNEHNFACTQVASARVALEDLQDRDIQAAVAR